VLTSCGHHGPIFTGGEGCQQFAALYVPAFPEISGEFRQVWVRGRLDFDMSLYSYSTQPHNLIEFFNSLGSFGFNGEDMIPARGGPIFIEQTLLGLVGMPSPQGAETRRKRAETGTTLNIKITQVSSR